MRHLAQINIRLFFYFIVLCIILSGLFFRIHYFFLDRSLWLDEVFLALNLIENDFISFLTGQTLYGQNAPPGFMALLFGVIAPFSISEKALRLLPFIFSVLSLFFYCYILFKYFSNKTVLIALFLFATSGFLINYSAEFKPYSLDVLLTICIMYLGFRYINFEIDRVALVSLSIVGCCVIWFSYPVCILLAGLGITLFIDRLKVKDKESLINLTYTGFLWCLSFLILFFVHYYPSMQSQKETGGFAYHAMNYINIWPIDIENFQHNKALIFRILMDLSTTSTFKYLLILIPLGVGTVVLKRSKYSLFLLFPFIILFLLAVLKLYPLATRMILFVFPIIFLIIALGLNEIIRGKYAWVPTLFVIIIISPILLNTIEQSTNPLKREHVRPLINHYINEKSAGEKLYILGPAILPYKYYSNLLSLSEAPVKHIKCNVNSEYNESVFINNFENENKPFWLLTSHHFGKVKTSKTKIESLLRDRFYLVNQYNLQGSDLQFYRPIN